MILTPPRIISMAKQGCGHFPISVVSFLLCCSVGFISPRGTLRYWVVLWLCHSVSTQVSCSGPWHILSPVLWRVLVSSLQNGHLSSCSRGQASSSRSCQEDQQAKLGLLPIYKLGALLTIEDEVVESSGRQSQCPTYEGLPVAYS